MKTLIRNATIINEGDRFVASLLIAGQFIEKIIPEGEDIPQDETVHEIDARGLLLIPGVIDDQVHFREPGLTHKGDIFTESRAAVAGGVTSYMEMPNTNPQSTTIELLEEKYAIAAEKSLANYSFYMGATNDNLDEVLRVDPRKVCGIKVFMGSSTGNMLVDNPEVLSNIFKDAPTLIAAHCEDEKIIQQNLKTFKNQFAEPVDWSIHPKIRSEEACYSSSAFAVKLAKEHNARLHILHISTEKELELFDNSLPLKDKKITAEVCVHHLWFADKDYDKHGSLIKWNPAVKKERDKNALLAALKNNKLDVVATDHAPHAMEEKLGSYDHAASGGPLVQHSLVAMLQLAREGHFTEEVVVEKMCQAPAELFRIDRRGYIREGFYADLVLIDPQKTYKVTKENLLYKCGWSPFERQLFDNSVVQTFVNGKSVYKDGYVNEEHRGMRLEFNV